MYMEMQYACTTEYYWVVKKREIMRFSCELKELRKDFIQWGNLDPKK